MVHFERFNRKEKRAIGLTLMDFSVLVQLTNLGPRGFPLSGLEELDSEWRDAVIEIITTPPVNTILKVLVYTPSFNETMPITTIENPSILLAI